VNKISTAILKNIYKSKLQTKWVNCGSIICMVGGLNFAPFSAVDGRGLVATRFCEKPLLLSEYLELAGLDAETCEEVKVVSRATGVVTSGSEIIANALLVSPELVLVDAHSFMDSHNHIKFASKERRTGITVFDGRTDSDVPTDVKVVRVPLVEDRKPAKLSVTTETVGSHIQISYCQTGKYRGRSYVKAYDKPITKHASRSDRAWVKTRAGECGSPRFSFSLMAVTGMHQGEREGFTMNQLVQCLENAKPGYKRDAEEILAQLNIPDLVYRYIDASTVSLKPGAVAEEVRVPAREPFANYLLRVSFRGVNRAGEPRYRVRFNHLHRYLREYDDKYVNGLVIKAFEEEESLKWQQ
jgi:hypothetical protein